MAGFQNTANLFQAVAKVSRRGEEPWFLGLWQPPRRLLQPPHPQPCRRQPQQLPPPSSPAPKQLSSSSKQPPQQRKQLSRFNHHPRPHQSSLRQWRYSNSQ